MKILSGQANLPLARKIAAHLNLELTEVKVTKFNDGEISVSIKQQLTEQVAVIVQSMAPPVNDHLMELLLLIRAAKEAAARKIIVIIPYFGYGRSDKNFSAGGVIAAKLMADLLQVAGAEMIITTDIHSVIILDFFSVPILNLAPTDLYLSKINLKNNLIVISPDLGGERRARNFAQAIKAKLAVITKQRLANSSCLMLGIDAEITGKNCLLIDDIIDTGQTISQAIKFLKQRGASSVDCLISHGLLSAKTANNLARLAVDNIYLSNSVNLNYFNLEEKFKIVDIAEQIAWQLAEFA